MISPEVSCNMTDAARLKFDVLKSVMIQLSKERGKGGRLRRLAPIYASQLSEAGVEMSGERLRKKFNEWERLGDRALIDLRLCGGGLSVRQKAKTRIPARVLALWHAERHQRADKDKDAAAWRWLIQRLAEGHHLEGVGTWQDLWFELHPHDGMPSACPWSVHRPPPGWTLSNFQRQPGPSLIADAMAIEGYGKAKSLASRHAGVNIDWSSLRPMELVFFDDVELDFKAIVDGQIVTLVLLMARDARSRRILAYGVRPRLRTDGIRVNVTRRDMQHLIAGLLYTFGLPRDYDVKLIVENAAAAVCAEFEPVLSRATQGRVTVDRTGVYDKAVKVLGFSEKSGSPNAKALHESGFRLMHIELANVRGQKGRNYMHKPGDADGRDAETMRMLKNADAGALINPDGSPLMLPYCDLWEAHEEVNKALRRIDARTVHDMEGFLTVNQFRFSDGDPVFRPLNPELFSLQSAAIQADIQTFLTLPQELQNRFLSYATPRRESPAECWQRLVQVTPFIGLSKGSLFEMMMDVSKPFEYVGTNAVKLDIFKQRLEFTGADHELVPGCVYHARFNADNPEQIWLQDLAGRCVGTMARAERLDWHDLDGRKRAMGLQLHVLAEAQKEVQTLQLSHPAAIRELQSRERSLHLLNPTPQGIPVSSGEIEASGDLLEAVSTGKRAPKPKAQTEADLKALLSAVG
jgi:hypothetical protein